MTAASDKDRERIAELLGRTPQGSFEVAVRDPDGDPVVIKNAPFLADGTPMPTLYWLVSPSEIRRVGQLESVGGVDQAERDIDPDLLADAHLRYATERDTQIDPAHDGPRPSGGVGGTRRGVKCLHSHWAWHLAGGDDPVGRWIAQQFEPQSRSQPSEVAASFDVAVTIDPTETKITDDQHRCFVVPFGPTNLQAQIEHDPPRPEELTNALGAVDDYLDDLDRERRWTARSILVVGPAAEAVARIEAGTESIRLPHRATRSDLESVFRMVTAETVDERAANPGVRPHEADTIVGALCIVLAIARRYRLDEVHLGSP